ncbi:fumarate hydratase subunit alpha [Candidatus Hakubella thermalkaliphila]|uniref:Fumarate hydratase subunit alpha n=1 Tax=Candidatus Hakubella thermalkaliphila TaxID=2754717 RepID=A0A6V8QCY2_9ACTN|nr:fumarate hydratase [Candidatus Hakubella thermalkaliphila]GFP19562.1 fumarate hydratase subunit alpha [Candidatus Hakubella thermalkaliphila]GFP29738.1 fumarate hydratase subunit alpha [Candidatus Hakubella thermalkaliphila]GFP39770.1 fumarate hydratase subunit alpha [Candidatus Hakubella thermalkaliphila]GFP42608.1 fumarate hydratase subunit alpha [Candidatus Hakubella thermalkaliphila]
MREVPIDKIIEVVRGLFIAANTQLGQDIVEALDRALEKEESPIGKEVLVELKENAEIARREEVPICQDTGLAVLFVDLGQDVHIVGGDFIEAVNEGVRRGYQEGYLRKSACHPFSRKNTGDNTPAIIHVNIVPGDRIKIAVVPKGGGSENMSRVAMLTPAVGAKGVIDYVVQTVEESGPNPCPPLVVGVGIGGSLEKATLMAKRSLLRPLDSQNPDPELAKMEEEILSRVNKLGIGPQGYGGRITALGVHIEMAPCHIASLPVAVNIQCHAARHKEAVI